MAITNGYCTLANFKADKRIQPYSIDIGDDGVIEDIIADASRLIDQVCNRTFYSRTETRYYDIPSAPYSNQYEVRSIESGVLKFDDDLLAITTLTNGDGTTIASTQYNLLDYNKPRKHSLQLKDSSTVNWTADASGNTRAVISIAGTWGYVNRAATDADSVRVISNTARACRMIAMHEYLKRFGKSEEVAQITGAGVVIVPSGEIPKEAFGLINNYQRYGLA